MPKLTYEQVQICVALVDLKFSYQLAQYSKDVLFKQINMHYAMFENQYPNESFEQYVARLSDRRFFLSLLEKLSINTTEMFRDPTFFALLRNSILPQMRSYPNIRIWSAGCSSGEEAYSLAVLCHECGILSRTQIYATDFNPHILLLSQKGGIPIHKIAHYSENYRRSGGDASFTQYFKTSSRRAYLIDALKEKITFSVHNLTHDASFNEFHLILCRNVLIYYQNATQIKILKLFSDSLPHNGKLALGRVERLSHDQLSHLPFASMPNVSNIYSRTVE